MTKFKRLFIVSMVMLMVAIIGCHGDKKEICRRNKNKYFCQERELKEIPSDVVGPDVTILFLYDNQIESTEQLDIHLSMFNKLQVLDMHNNRLNRVPRTPQSVMELNFDSNEINRIDWQLHKLGELKKLSLISNKLNDASFNVNTFSETTQLEELNLDNNKLTFIPKNLPWSLKRLSLKNNSIISINRLSLNHLVNLEYLTLEENFITNDQIEKNSFSYLNVLKTLDLKKNKLKDVPLGLPYALNNLYLSYNQIEYIKIEDGPHSGTLFKFEELQYVDLSYNQLRSVQPRALDSVKAALLAGNKWVCDCWLNYLTSWLETSISHQKGLICAGPKNLINTQIKNAVELRCESRFMTRSRINAATDHKSIRITWQQPYEPPSFVETLVLYGECVNCSERTMNRYNIAVEDMTSRYKITNFTFQQTNKLATELNNLKSDTTYQVCVFDSEQNRDDVTNNQCRLIKTGEKPQVDPDMDPVYLALIVLSTLLLLTVLATATYCLYHHNLPGFSKFKRKTTTTRLSPVDLERQFLHRNHQSLPPRIEGHPDDYLNQQLRPQPAIPVTNHNGGYDPHHHHNNPSDYNTRWSNRTYAECGSYHLSQQRHPSRAPTTSINHLVPPIFQPRDEDYYHDNRDAAVDATTEFQSLLPGNRKSPPYETPIPRVPVRNSPIRSNIPSSLDEEGNTRLSSPLRQDCSDLNAPDTMSTNDTSIESTPSLGRKFQVPMTTHNHDVITTCTSRQDDVMSPYDHLIPQHHSSAVTSPSFLRNSSALSRDSEYQQVHHQGDTKWYG